MQDEDAMDALLRQALAAPVPQLSPGFDERMRRRLRPRRLTPAGRAVMVAYALMALAVAGWLMRELSPAVLAGAAASGVVVAAGASVYARWLVFGG